MKKTLNTEIVAVGTELLLGQIANTNAQWISEQLALNGINTFYHTVVGDNLNRLKNVLKKAASRSDIIIISGGLGPTEDDLSREAFYEISQIPIVRHDASLQKIIDFFAKHNVEMTPNNKRQARVFKDSIVLMNEVGMAPGNIVHYADKVWIFVPGVPREMKKMFVNDVIPYLKQMNGENIIESETLNFIGIGESILEHKLSKLIKEQENPTIAPLAARDGITLRLTAKAASSEAAKQLIDELKAKILLEVGEYVYGVNRETIEEAVFNLLKANNKKIAAAESLTGGAFQEKITSLSGSSEVFTGGVVCYDPNVKINLVNVKEETITQYGTVSEQCAQELAENIRENLQADIGVSFTGIAGPEAIEGKPVGTVYIALSDKNGYLQIEKYRFSGDRKSIRHRSVLKGYEILFNYLKLNS